MTDTICPIERLAIMKTTVGGALGFPLNNLASWVKDSDHTLQILNSIKMNGTYEFYVEATTTGKHRAYKLIKIKTIVLAAYPP